MTRGELHRPTSPGMASAAGRAKARAMLALALLVVAPTVSAIAPRAQAAKGGFPEGIIAEVRVEGNSSITTEQVRAKLKSRVGRPIERSMIDEDQLALDRTGWFSESRLFVDQAADGKGVVLVVRVVEMPILKDVQFIGLIDKWGHVRLKEIEESTGLKKGARADAAKALMAVNHIQTLYEEKGYEKAEVRLIEGGKFNDTRVVIEIFEGPKFTVGSIDFVGNTFVEDGVLMTKIESRHGWFGILGAKRHKDGLESDRRSLVKYYEDNGFRDIVVSATTKPGRELGREDLTFTISEGPQYKVRKVIIEGNKQLDAHKLRDGMLVRVGQPFNEAQREIDHKNLMSKYWSLGCIDTRIEKEQRVTEEPGQLDVVYLIDEGSPYLLGQIIIRGNARTKDKVVRREALMAGLLPGEVLDLNRFDKFKKRVGNTGFFVTNPQVGKAIDVQIVNKRPGDQPFGEETAIGREPIDLTRMQSPEQDPPPLGGPPLDLPSSPPGLPPDLPPLGDSPPPPPTPDPTPGASQGPQGLMPYGGFGQQFAPPANTVPRPSSPLGGPPRQGPPPGRLGPPPSQMPPDGFPNLPNSNMVDVGPDAQEPYRNRSYADIVTNLEESPTGRLMFGIGASSFGGLSGTAVVQESNFDLFAVPKSWDDLTSGRAFRGAGQVFRLELSPGTVINRYVVSFGDPYLFDLPLGFNLSGYQWSRYYQDWSERRSGGRTAIGYQFGPQIYADIAGKVEDVDIHGFKYPAPAALLAAAGHSTLASIRPSIRFDNRNNPFSPSQGSYLEAAFEEGFGTFSFPKFTVEGRQHFTLGSRPDNSGKRTLTFRGVFGVTGRDTPIYERFFAGDFRSLRGFYYRGVGPHVLGVNTGGILETLGSVEYQFPLTAGDKLQQVIFTDFGTVESNYSISNFRASIGTGLRVVIPQITGQMPLAFDLAFPIAKAEFDKTRYFTFFIGATW